jgi:hypothetical protein
MKCRNLVKMRDEVSCMSNNTESATDNGPYIPSFFQQHEYCTKSEHKKCPLYEGVVYASKTRMIEVLHKSPVCKR